jgi:hypothetical protein
MEFNSVVVKIILGAIFPQSVFIQLLSPELIDEIYKIIVGGIDAASDQLSGQSGEAKRAYVIQHAVNPLLERFETELPLEDKERLVTAFYRATRDESLGAKLTNILFD